MKVILVMPVVGGTLVCCDSCPAAYHAECLDISPPDDGIWHCKDCIAGRRPHYGEIVWVKLGSYRYLIFAFGKVNVMCIGLALYIVVLMTVRFIIVSMTMKRINKEGYNMVVLKFIAFILID